MMEIIGILVVLLLLIPVALLVIVAGVGLVRYLSARRFVGSAAHAEAVVVGLPSRMRRVSGGSGVSVPVRYFEPVVRFQTAQGALVEARVEVGTPTPSAAIGQSTPVLYDPQQPQRVRLAEADGQSGALQPFVVGCIGAIVLFMTVCVIGIVISALASG